MVAEYVPEIRELQAWVGTYAASSSQEFLRLGATLESCHFITGQILAAVRNILIVASGSDQESPLFAARQGLCLSLEGVSRTVDEYTLAFQDLTQARDALSQLTPLQSYLGKTLRSFEYVRVSYRIHAAELDAKTIEDMEILGEAMKSLSTSSAVAYEAQASRLYSATLVLELAVKHVANNVGALANAKQQTEALLAEIGAVQPAISQLTDHLLVHMQAIAANTVDLIVSLQMDDAVRQRLEHVCAMLDNIVARLEGSSAATGSELADLRWFIHAACGVLSRQVNDIGVSIAASGSRIEFALANTVEQTTALVEEAALLQGPSGTDQGHPASHGNFAAAASRLGDCFANGLAIEDTLLEKVGAAIEVSTSIGMISYRMKLLSLNVQIRSASPGGMAAIAVLSDHAKTLADDHSSATLEVEEGLARLRRVMESFSMLLESLAQNQGVASRELLTSSISYIAELSQTQAAIANGLEAISTQCNDLKDTTTVLLASVGFAASARSGIARLLALLDRLGSKPEESEEHLSDEAHAWLDQFKSKYTMHAERTLHEDGDVSDIPVGLLSPGSEFGDNAELF